MRSGCSARVQLPEPVVVVRSDRPLLDAGAQCSGLRIGLMNIGYAAGA